MPSDVIVGACAKVLPEVLSTKSNGLPSAATQGNALKQSSTNNDTPQVGDDAACDDSMPTLESEPTAMCMSAFVDGPLSQALDQLLQQTVGSDPAEKLGSCPVI